MEKWKSDIEKEFWDCMKKFPELKEREIRLVIKETDKDEVSGGAGRNIVSGKEIVLLNVHPMLKNHPRVLRPIIFHELSHKINLENPDEVFNERADEESKRLWKMLEENNALKCSVEEVI